MKNALGIEIPDSIPGFGQLTPYQGEWTIVEQVQKQPRDYTIQKPMKVHDRDHTKLCATIDDCLQKLDLKDGMTISFHHHMRSGDETIFPIVSKLAEMGYKNMTLASSSLTSAHECLLPYLQNGVITRIWTSGLRGSLGKAVSEGVLDIPAIFHSHGGRARAIETGKLKIDIAFIAAAAVDPQGNATGAMGQSACGSLGYAMVDAEYARQVVVVSDNIVPYPCLPASIIQEHVDYVVPIDKIGNPAKIAGDTTRITKNPMDLRIAKLASDAITLSGYVKPGYSLQAGAGGASLAVVRYLSETMRERNVTGSFMLGGVTSNMTRMLQEGLFHAIFDVQSFDAAVTGSLYHNPKHVEISASQYANPFNCGCMTHQLDIVILAALEIDTNFNVNVLVGSDGYIRGASGGHCDTAAGAKLTVVVAPSIRGRLPIVKKNILTVITPGSSVDLLVTERGICINPLRTDLIEAFKNSRLPIRDIHDLCEEVTYLCGVPREPEWEDKIVGLVEYRDGSIIDVIRKVKK